MVETTTIASTDTTTRTRPVSAEDFMVAVRKAQQDLRTAKTDANVRTDKGIVVRRFSKPGFEKFLTERGLNFDAKVYDDAQKYAVKPEEAINETRMRRYLASLPPPPPTAVANTLTAIENVEVKDDPVPSDKRGQLYPRARIQAWLASTDINKNDDSWIGKKGDQPLKTRSMENVEAFLKGNGIKIDKEALASVQKGAFDKNRFNNFRLNNYLEIIAGKPEAERKSKDPLIRALTRDQFLRIFTDEQQVAALKNAAPTSANR